MNRWQMEFIAEEKFKKNSMNDNFIYPLFTAKRAREISEKNMPNEIAEIIVGIKLQAGRGKTELDVTKLLQEGTLNILKSRGFDVISYPTVSVEKDGIYHTIMW